MQIGPICRISSYEDYDKCKLLVNEFVKPQFSYFLLIWMLCTPESNYRLNRVYKKALRIISEDYISSFSDLVTLLNEKTIYQRCILFDFKYLNGLSPGLINEVFRLKSNYHNLGSFNQLETYIPKTKSSLNLCVYRANQMWQLVPHKVRKSMSWTQFKSKISKWLCQECMYHLCKQCMSITSTKRFFSYYV